MRLSRRKRRSGRVRPVLMTTPLRRSALRACYALRNVLQANQLKAQSIKLKTAVYTCKIEITNYKNYFDNYVYFYEYKTEI